ncbi:MAG: LysM peptidoglycan-binding domain-containing protein [Hyphomicrobiaceae bacterium]
MRIWGLASVIASGVFVSAAGVWASGSTGDDPALHDVADQPVRTAAIHPAILSGNGRNDPRGEPMDRRSLVRPEPPAPMFAALAIEPSGAIIASGLGIAGETVSIWHNRRYLTSAKVGRDFRWKIASRGTLGSGDHHFTLQSGGPGNPSPQIGGEVRVSIPSGTRSRLNITFDRFAENEADLKRRAESVGDAATKAFDEFLQKKTAQASSDQRETADQDVTEDGDLREQLLTATQRWLGEAQEVYHREIVPRLQLGGGLTLPESPEAGDGNTVRSVRLDRVALPTLDDTTRIIQAWFGQAADNYDDEILPRLSGARAPRIVLHTEIPERPERKPAAFKRPRAEERVVVERRPRQEVVRELPRADQQLIEAEKRAAEERRLAALRLRREREEEARRERREEARRRTEARRQAEDDLRKAREERARAERERLRIERARQQQQQEEQRRAAARRQAEENLRAAEAERQRAVQERLRLERQLSEQRIAAKREEGERRLAARRSSEQVRAQRERELALQARRRAEAAAAERQRRAREKAEAARRQAEFRVSEVWQRARQAANRTVRQFRFRQREESATAPAPLPERRRISRQANEGKRIARAPVSSPRRVADQRRKVRRQRRKIARQKTRRVASRLRSARRPSKQRHRRRAVRGYRRRSPGRCRHWSRYRIRLPGKYVVRKGDSLWRISRRHYRSGRRYRLIYRANRHLIRNPNLIYPCQRFYLPRGKSRRRR